MLSDLTAPTVPVESLSQLREGAGKNHGSTALVLMLQASIAPATRLGHEDKERLMKVSELIMLPCVVCTLLFVYVTYHQLFLKARHLSDLAIFIGWRCLSRHWW